MQSFQFDYLFQPFHGAHLLHLFQFDYLLQPLQLDQPPQFVIQPFYFQPLLMLSELVQR